GDGVADIAIGPDTGGGPRLQVLAGKTFGKLMPDFFGLPYPDFRGGLRLAIADVNRDGHGELIVAPGAGGGPRVSVYNGRSIGPGKNPTVLINDFFVFDASLRTGISLAAGDVNGDGYADLIAGIDTGGGPRVRVISGAELAAGRGGAIADFWAGGIDDRSGLRLSVRNYDGDNRADIMVGSGAGTFVRTYTGSSVIGNPNPSPIEWFESFPGVGGGVYVG
ncbi:MAG TPA: FG-GAP repeat protein, partial [Gemmataceae bacterium]|nr:FG-GAP repeat protein [Gemmataceae bacterium]